MSWGKAINGGYETTNVTIPPNCWLNSINVQKGTKIKFLVKAKIFTEVLDNILNIATIEIGTYRTKTDGTWPSGTATWERATTTAGGWIASGIPPKNTSDLLIIKHTITSRDVFAASAPGTKMQIESGGTFIDNHSSSFASLTIENGGVFSANSSSITINATSGTITLDSGGLLKLNSSSISGISSIWSGTENFKSGSTIEIMNWEYDASNGDNRLIQNPSIITLNSDGYYFGNVIISGTLSKIFVISEGSQTINFCKNNLTVSATVNKVAFTNSASNVTVGGNVIVQSGTQLSFAATSSGNPISTIKGNLTCNGGTIDLNQSSSGLATSTLNLGGNLDILSSTSLKSTDAGCKIAFNGITTQTVSVVAGTLKTNVAFEVTNGSIAQLINQNLDLFNDSNKFTVLTGGTLDFNYLDIIGLGDFILSEHGVLKITSANGVNANGTNLGNIQSTGTRTYSQTGHYYYVGNVDLQSTGTAMNPDSSTAKLIVIDKANASDVVNLTQSVGTSNQIIIKRGVFIETDIAYVYGSGQLNMGADGYYKSAVTSANLPRLTGNYYLTLGSTIELNASVNQTLKGNKEFRNLKFSTSGTKTISSAINSIIGTVTISDSAILDVDNNSFGGADTNITMTDTSHYITAGTGVKPDAQGIYSLGIGTKLSFTNTANTLESIRLAPNYYNIDIVGSNVGTSTFSIGIKFQPYGTFTVKSTGNFKFKNTDGFTGSTTTAINNSNSPTVTLDLNSTLEYAGADQTVTNFAPYYRNVTISGTGIKTNTNTTFINEDLNVNGSKLLVNTNDVITVKQAVKIATTDSAEIEIKNNGQLIQIDEVDSNSGTNFKVNRIATINKFDYVYWSSPVDNFNVSSITGSYKYLWNTTINNTNGTQGNWTTASGPMTKGKGYIVRAPNTFPIRPANPTTLPVTFLGKPNNGQFDFAITRGTYDGGDYDADLSNPTNELTTKYDDNWNLVGNPYPSAIDAEAFLVLNSTKIKGAVWIWKHGTAPDAANATPFYQNYGTSYSSSDYLKYNLLGSSEPDTFNGKIASGQGFMVNMSEDASSNNITFQNSLRAATHNNTNFYRNANELEEKSRIWLNIVNSTSGKANTTLIGYATNATQGEDHLYDCVFIPEGELALYSLINSNPFVIQGRSLPFDTNDIVPLGIKIMENGTHKIAVNTVDGLFENTSTGIYLEDRLLNIVHDLRQSPYLFTTNIGRIDNRFLLRYTNEALENPSFEAVAKAVLIANKNNQINIQSSIESIESVTVYDVLGRLLFEKSKLKNNTFIINNLAISNQTLIVKIVLENRQTVSKKIVF